MPNTDTEALKNRHRIRELFRDSQKLGIFPITILYRPNGKEGEKGVLFCSQRSAKRAVDRNRVKRILRVHVRDCIGDLPCGYDYAFIAHKSISDMIHTDREDLFSRLIRKLSVSMLKQ